MIRTIESFAVFNGRRSRLLAAGAVVTALVLSTGGVALAVIPGPGSNQIHGCYKKTSGALRVVYPAKKQHCKKTEKKLNWNQRGINWRGAYKPTTSYSANDAVSSAGSSYVAVRNSKGAAVTNTSSWAVLAAGAPAAGVVAWAEIGSTGLLKANKGFRATVKQGTGEYCILPTDQTLMTSHPAVFASAIHLGAVTPVLFVMVPSDFGCFTDDGRGYGVHVRDLTGSPIDAPFYFFVA